MPDGAFSSEDSSTFSRAFGASFVPRAGSNRVSASTIPGRPDFVGLAFARSEARDGTGLLARSFSFAGFCLGGDLDFAVVFDTAVFDAVFDTADLDAADFDAAGLDADFESARGLDEVDARPAPEALARDVPVVARLLTGSPRDGGSSAWLA